MFDKTKAGVVVSTYSMMGYQGKRSDETNKLLETMRSVEWGLLILDEV